MTRWKREFREWAGRENLRVWTTPKRPEDWHRAQEYSRVLNHLVRSPWFERRAEETMARAMIHGFAPLMR